MVHVRHGDPPTYAEHPAPRKVINTQKGGKRRLVVRNVRGVGKGIHWGKPPKRKPARKLVRKRYSGKR